MLLKLAAIFAMFAGLFTYAQSSAMTEPPRVSRTSFVEQLKRVGYVEIDQSAEPRGLTNETFELKTPSTPHHHTTAWLYLTCRGDQVVNFGHDESWVNEAD
jgi:hypothetical protein